MNRQKKYYYILLVFFIHVGCLTTYGQKEVDYTRFIMLKKGYKVYPYPETSLKTNNFMILEPGLPVLPLLGGLYAPSLKTWLADPAKPYITASDQFLTTKDTFLQVLKTDPAAKSVWLQKVKRLDNNNQYPALCKLPYGQYDFKLSVAGNAFIWGVDSAASHLWFFDNKQIKMLYTTTKYLSDLAVVNDANVLVAQDSTVWLIGCAQPPKVFIKLDLPIDGLSLTDDGTLFVSTVRGILHFYSAEADDFDVVTKTIHGRIRIYRNKLFVLWREKNQVVEIKLK